MVRVRVSERAPHDVAQGGDIAFGHGYHEPRGPWSFAFIVRGARRDATGRRAGEPVEERGWSHLGARENEETHLFFTIL